MPPSTPKISSNHFTKMKSIALLVAFFNTLTMLVSISDGACHPDDLKKDLEEITVLHRESIDLLMKALENSAHGTITSLDLEEVLHTHTVYDTQKENYVSAVKKIYEISVKLDRNIAKDGRWSLFSKIAVRIKNKTNVLNASCFRAANVVVDTSGGEDVLVEKLLKAVLEMFIAETFLNEHFNHLIEPYSKI